MSGEEDEIAIATPPSTIAFSAWTNASVIRKLTRLLLQYQQRKSTFETPGPVAATKADMSPTQVAVTKVTPVTAALKTPAQNPPWWTRAYPDTNVAAQCTRDTIQQQKSSHRRFSDPVARRVTFALSGGTNDGGNTTTLDRQEPDIATVSNIHRRRRRRWQ
jgi:hypothetical protein